MSNSEKRNGLVECAGKIFYNNALHDSVSDVRIPVINPATEQQVSEIVSPTEQEIDKILTIANAAQKKWANTDAKTRAAYLHKIADSIEHANHQPVAEAMSLEMGKPYPEALGEIANVGPVFRYMTEMARDDGGHIAGTTQMGSFQYCRYEPLGVSVHIMPFNFPILLFAWTAAASLACGNAFVMKPAEATSISSLMFMDHFKVLPEGLASCITGNASVGSHLVASELTHAVAFTGSVAVGRRVNIACAEAMKPAVIEAGGNDAMIIAASADIEIAAAGSICAAFHLSGQVCTSAERFFVVDAIHDEFVEAFAKRAKALRIGHGLSKAEIGPVVNMAARDRIKNLVDKTVAQGATIVCGGKIPAGFDKGAYYEPTILTDVTDDMEIMNSEVFGPVAAICRVKDVDEAIAKANNSQFGLGACIFTNDFKEATKATELLQTGMVWVNNPMIDNDALPFGGAKMSGLGRELGREGLNAFRQSKMVIQDADPIMHDWWYPYPDSAFHPDAE